MPNIVLFVSWLSDIKQKLFWNQTLPINVPFQIEYVCAFKIQKKKNANIKAEKKNTTATDNMKVVNFCPALTNLALDLHVKKCMYEWCLSVFPVFV